MTENYIEWIGYAASFFVAVSFTFRSMSKFRIVNILGCIFFIAYGVLIDSIPVIIANLYILGMNFYHLLKRDKPIPL
ncbi:MAG: YgjV family protein [Bacteroidota bacterium]